MLITKLKEKNGKIQTCQWIKLECDQCHKIEEKCLCWITQSPTQIKKEAAEKWCKSKNMVYIIYTESDYDILTDNEIIELTETNKIVWLEKYYKKYKQRIKKEKV